LAVEERIVPAGRGVVGWRLVCERGEGERVGVQERGGKPPWIGLCPGSWVEVFCVFVSQAVMSRMVIDISIVERREVITA